VDFSPKAGKKARLDERYFAVYAASKFKNPTLRCQSQRKTLLDTGAGGKQAAFLSPRQCRVAAECRCADVSAGDYGWLSDAAGLPQCRGPSSNATPWPAIPSPDVLTIWNDLKTGLERQPDLA